MRFLLKNPYGYSMNQQLSYRFQVWLEMGRLASSGKWDAWHEQKTKRAGRQIAKPLLSKAAISEKIAQLNAIRHTQPN